MTCEAEKSKMVFLLSGDGEYVPDVAWGLGGKFVVMPGTGVEVLESVEGLYEEFEGLVGVAEDLLVPRLLKIYALLRDLVAEVATPEQTRAYEPLRVYMDFRDHVFFTDEERRDGVEGRDLRLAPATARFEREREWFEDDCVSIEGNAKLTRFYMCDWADYLPGSDGEAEEIVVNVVHHAEAVARLVEEFFEEVELLKQARDEAGLVEVLVRFYVIGRDLVELIGTADQRADHDPPFVYRARGGKPVFTRDEHPRAPEGRQAVPRGGLPGRKRVRRFVQ
jgi:hypothetical protein